MKQLPSLEKYVEDYLKHEGLYRVIPEYRRSSVLALPIHIIWAVVQWALFGYIVVSNKGLNGWLIALLLPPSLFMVVTLIFAGWVIYRQFRFNKTLQAEDNNVVAAVYLFGLPVLLSATLGLYLLSWQAFAAYFILSMITILIITFLHSNSYRVHLIVELFGSVFKVLGRSVALLVFLIPVLLVIVLLSVFSQELWQALGNLSLGRVIGSTFLIILPAALLAFRSLDSEAERIVRVPLEREELIQAVADIPYIGDKIKHGLVSAEEWMKATDELTWRDQGKMADELLPIVRDRVRLWLALLLLFNAIVLILTFSIYFYILFHWLIGSTLIALWMEIPPESVTIPVEFLGYSGSLTLQLSAIAIAKVSLLLSVFVAVASSVYALTDDSFKERLTTWLDQKAISWIAASSMYSSIISPQYQVWEYIAGDRRRGIANVSIVVPKGLSEAEIEEACKHMESRLSPYRNIVTVTAFEQNIENPNYKRGMPGRRWQLTHNKVKSVFRFEPADLVLEEARYEHLLGLNYSKKGDQIPDEWFGNTAKGAGVAREIWDSHGEHELILHPYINETQAKGGTILHFDLHLMKRLATSDQYRQLIRGVLTTLQRHYPDTRILIIAVQFRDTLELIADFQWMDQYVSYRDEFIGKTKLEKLRQWDLPQVNQSTEHPK